MHIITYLINQQQQQQQHVATSPIRTKRGELFFQIWKNKFRRSLFSNKHSYFSCKTAKLKDVAHILHQRALKINAGMIISHHRRTSLGASIMESCYDSVVSYTRKIKQPNIQ